MPAIQINAPGISASALQTSAQDAVVTSTVANLNQAQPGSFTILVESRITTNNVVATFTPQVSDDQTTWYDCRALVETMPTGTGAPIVTTRAISVPLTAKYIRCKAVLSGASTVSADKTKIDYRSYNYGQIS